MAPTGTYLSNLLHNYYFKPPDKSVPVIAVHNAATLSVIYTILYVLPFYLFNATRPSPTLSRDAPSVIRARIRTVTISCIFSSLATVYLVVFQAKATVPEALKLMGWWPVHPMDIARTWLLTALLFLGPLFEKGIVESEWRSWVRGQRIAETLGGWIGWRNYIAGPVTEEVIFRSVLIPLHLLAKVSPTHIVFFTPLYFGIAHIHHFYEFTLTHPHTPLLPALARSLFQFGYTTLFGWYATFVYLRTSSIYAVILVHAFCNWCGLPRFWGRVEAGEPLGPPLMRGKEDADLSRDPEADGSLGTSWTVAYYVLLVTGAVAFYVGLWPLTDSSMALASFDAGATAS